jgi:hypothetical protein
MIGQPDNFGHKTSPRRPGGFYMFETGQYNLSYSGIGTPIKCLRVPEQRG